jgi:hypothetical protein
MKKSITAILMTGSSLLLSCAGPTGDDELGTPELGESKSKLILNVHNGKDDVWTAADRVNITYCIAKGGSSGFGEYYGRAVHEVYQATQDWERAAYVKFVHKSEYDENCNRDAPIMFPILRDPYEGSAYATSFPPHVHYEPYDPNTGVVAELCIAIQWYDTLDRAVDKRTSRGTFSHELGHILGFRHEHIRPEASQPPYSYTCNTEADEDPWRTIAGYTQYDPNSIMHYGGLGGCGPLKDYALDATDKAAAFVVYPAPRRCEVWAGSTKLGQTTLTGLTSAADGDSKCQSYATTNYQKNGRLFATVERHSDHYRAIMTSSSSKACSLSDSILLFTPGLGFRRPAENLNYEVQLGKVAFNPPDPSFDGTLMLTYGTEGAQSVGFLYDKTSGFIKNSLSKNVSFCANDDSTIWAVVRAGSGDIPFYAYTPQGQSLQGVLKPLAYGSYTLSIDGMGGNDTFNGGDGNDVFTDLTGNNSASGYGGNDTLKLCNYNSIDCGSGSGDKAFTCKTDTTGTITGCESRSTF